MFSKPQDALSTHISITRTIRTYHKDHWKDTCKWKETTRKEKIELDQGKGRNLTYSNRETDRTKLKNTSW